MADVDDQRLAPELLGIVALDIQVIFGKTRPRPGIEVLNEGCEPATARGDVVTLRDHEVTTLTVRDSEFNGHYDAVEFFADLTTLLIDGTHEDRLLEVLRCDFRTRLKREHILFYHVNY
jgi:hypothetical protein